MAKRRTKQKTFLERFFGEAPSRKKPFKPHLAYDPWMNTLTMRASSDGRSTVSHQVNDYVDLLYNHDQTTIVGVRICCIRELARRARIKLPK